MLLKTSLKVRQAEKIIESSAGRIFKATWVKADKKKRSGLFRIGVSQYAKGVGKKYDPKKYGLRSVWEIQEAKGAEAYRTIDLKTLRYLKVDQNEYFFN